MKRGRTERSAARGLKPHVMGPRSIALRVRLLAGSAVLALTMAGAAAAQVPSVPQKDAPACQAGCTPGSVDRQRFAEAAAAAEAARRNPLPPGPVGEDGFYLEADQLIDDGESKRVIARGSVEARYRGRTLRARELEYRTETGVVIARGDAQLLNADGTAQFAETLELDEDLSAGVATGFSTQLGQGVRVAAASAVRRSETVTDLNKAVYTPCDVCSDEGRPKSPTFSIQAEQVTQDRNRRIIRYRNAVIRVKGVPVLYTPVFFHPDPEAPRASGLLVPDLSLSDKRGVSYEQPYYWAISPSQDLTITPQINTKVNPLLNLEYRKRFYSGQLEARVGYTYEQDFNSEGDRFGEDTHRSYILSSGGFRINEAWRWGYTAERVSDDLLFDKYGIGDVYADRGLYLADSQRLISQVYTTRVGDRSYLSLAALNFQGLRPGDDESVFPTVGPLVEGRWEPRTPIAGGRLRLRGGGVVLTRDEGVDSRRGTVEADWRRAFTFASGLRVEPLAWLRGDYYSIEDGAAFDDSVARGNATVGAELSWPLIRRTGGTSILLEPIVQVLVSPDADRSADVPNEDSTVFTFDETNLFDVNRYPGFDRYEGGQRVNVGGRATFAWGAGKEASLFAGRSFRAEEDLAFSPTSGLREEGSDYVVAASATPLAGLYLFSRARLDGDTLEVRRGEAAANVYLERVRGGVRYYFDDANPLGIRTHEVDFIGEALFTRNWGVVFSGVRDLEDQVWRRRDIGLLYTDECVRLEVIYEREETFNRTLGPSESVSVRLSLATLGASGYRDYDER
jgi:LPS-assembly protein